MPFNKFKSFHLFFPLFLSSRIWIALSAQAIVKFWDQNFSWVSLFPNFLALIIFILESFNLNQVPGLGLRAFILPIIFFAAESFQLILASDLSIFFA